MLTKKISGYVSARPAGARPLAAARHVTRSRRLNTFFFSPVGFFPAFLPRNATVASRCIDSREYRVCSGGVYTFFNPLGCLDCDGGFGLMSAWSRSASHCACAERGGRERAGLCARALAPFPLSSWTCSHTFVSMFL